MLEDFISIVNSTRNAITPQGRQGMVDEWNQHVARATCTLLFMDVRRTSQPLSQTCYHSPYNGERHWYANLPEYLIGSSLHVAEVSCHGSCGGGRR